MGYGVVVVKVAQYRIVEKVSKQGATTLAIYHSYYCGSLTAMEIRRGATGPRGAVPEGWARPGQRADTASH